MLRHKDTIKLTEINDFFTTSEKAMETIFRLIRSLKFSDKRFGFSQASNLEYSSYSKLILLLLLPFFDVKTSCYYSDSSLHKFFCCGKDVFYRLINSTVIDWRGFAYSLSKQLIRKTANNSDKSDHTRCLIIDDTDLPKTGRCMELMGRIYSHVSHSSLLGFKGLFMGFHDGKSFFALDFSLHGEKGKNKKKPYGLTPSQSKKRFVKKRDKSSMGKVRVDEYSNSKIDVAINMIACAIKKGIRFDYLLVDSWFTCFALVKFITTRRVNCHFLGMIKMGKTRYNVLDKEQTAREIVDILRRRKKIKRSKLTGHYYAEIIVDFKGIPVKLYFSKASKRGNWHGIMTTNTDLTFNEAYKIYSIRWSVEVFFKESKQLLGLGKCQSQDFDAQIASTTICLLQYNILSVAKRFDKYETLGELFRTSQKETLELTIAERIFLIIREVVIELSEILEIDSETLMEKLLSENERFVKYLNLKPFMQAG